MMPMIPVHVDSATVAVTSLVSAAITFGFCRAMGLKHGPSLAIAAGVGIALYGFGVIPIGLLAVVGIAMLGTIFKVMFSNPTQKQKPDIAGSQWADLSVTGGAGRVSQSTNSNPDAVQRDQSSAMATIFCNLTLNAPNEENFNHITSVCPKLTEVDKARLRICITVAQAILFLWYFERLSKAVDSSVSHDYEAAMLRELRENDFDVSLEDYVPLKEERATLLLDGPTRTKTTVTSDGKHTIRVSDLIVGLRSTRRKDFIAALRTDLEEGGSISPLAETSQLIVRGYLGNEPSAVSYGPSLMVMIGSYLAAGLAGVHKVLVGR